MYTGNHYDLMLVPSWKPKVKLKSVSNLTNELTDNDTKDEQITKQNKIKSPIKLSTIKETDE